MAYSMPLDARDGAGMAGGGGNPAQTPASRPKKPTRAPRPASRMSNRKVFGKAARQWLAEHTDYLDFIRRVADGKPIKLSGPTGKRVWHYPDWSDVKWANELIASKNIPAVTAQEISGPDGQPIASTQGAPPPSPEERAERYDVLAQSLARAGVKLDGPAPAKPAEATQQARDALATFLAKRAKGDA